MVGDSKKLLSTGEFAKLCGTTKDTLFHYEEIGILIPFKKNRNGYRYYTFEQIQQFYTIGVLKELGVTLSGLKEYLEDEGSEKYINLLKLQEKVITKKINNLIGIQKALKDKIDIAEKHNSIKDGYITIEKLKSETLLVSERLTFTNALDITEHIKNLFTICKDENLHTNYEVGFIKDLSILKEESDTTSFKIFIKVYNFKKNKKINKTKEGKYLVAYHKGDFFNLNQTYINIINYANENKITLKGPIYESGIINEIYPKFIKDTCLKLYVEILD